MDNKKVIFFVLSMTVLVALGLTTLRELTYNVSVKNEDIFNKRAVLSSLNDQLSTPVKELSDEQVLDIFDKQVEQLVLDATGAEVTAAVKAEKIDMAKEKKKPAEERMYPLFILNNDQGKFYVMSVRGNGLWDEIWGYIALEGDLNTIAGTSFDHKGETPGLGAEIKDNPSFPARFKGKKIYNEDGEYVSVLVKKGGADPSNPHAVDGISGATVTADGVTKMLQSGIEKYRPYLEKMSEGNSLQGMLQQ